MNKIWKRLGLLKTLDTVEKTKLAMQSVNYYVTSFFWRCFRDSIWVHRIENRVPRIR